ncbi:hypothetical protein ACQP1S_12230 [Micromonospora matsumotoense]|uniref:hypothetical protein n=1 Tax=Micromonospora matsumotoense TaxID=121616 RepID=UPI003D92B0AF
MTVASTKSSRIATFSDVASPVSASTGGTLPIGSFHHCRSWVRSGEDTADSAE